MRSVQELTHPYGGGLDGELRVVDSEERDRRSTVDKERMAATAAAKATSLSAVQLLPTIFLLPPEIF